jgi:hypothetical protein
MPITKKQRGGKGPRQAPPAKAAPVDDDSDDGPVDITPVVAKKLAAASAASNRGGRGGRGRGGAASVPTVLSHLGKRTRVEAEESEDDDDDIVVGKDAEGEEGDEEDDDVDEGQLAGAPGDEDGEDLFSDDEGSEAAGGAAVLADEEDEEGDDDEEEEEGDEDEEADEDDAAANGAGDGEDNTNRFILFIGNIPFLAKKEQILRHFACVGEKNIVGLRLLTKKQKEGEDSGPAEHKGCGFIEFKNEPALKKALMLHHTFIKGAEGRKINVELTVSVVLVLSVKHRVPRPHICPCRLGVAVRGRHAWPN